MKKVKEIASKVKGKAAKKQEALSFRLKCAKTGNSLSHYIVYGDVEQKI